MELSLLVQDPAQLATPLLVVFAVDIATKGRGEAHPILLTASGAVADAAARVLGTGEFQGKLGEAVVVHGPAGLRAERLLIVGLGNAKQLTPHEVRKGGGVAVRTAKARAIRDLAVVYPDGRGFSDEPLDELPRTATMRALTEGALLAEPDYDTYKSDRKIRAIATLALLAESAERSERAELQDGLDEGQALGAAQNWARALVNEPGNVLTPTELGRRAKAMADAAGLQCTVEGAERVQELGMGAFWAVAKGSEEAPALVTMTYEPEGGAAEGAPVLGLVGKGVTFDTGGISIKPGEGMEKMKYDMAGAAAMLGAMHAIATLRPKVKVVCVVCSAENMPDGRAYKPGDVVTAMSGTTVEIINTDAEGRLLLADGLHYAKTLGCTHLINAATLTGAVAVALGRRNAGMFSNDEGAAAAFTDAMRKAGEAFWRLPCTADYREDIVSAIADIRNTGATRYGGAITAAMFLKEFAGETPWVHLDIAGVAWEDDNRGWVAKGPTGAGVRSTVEWVRRLAQ